MRRCNHPPVCRVKPHLALPQMHPTNLLQVPQRMRQCNHPPAHRVNSRAMPHRTLRPMRQCNGQQGLHHYHHLGNQVNSQQRLQLMRRCNRQPAHRVNLQQWLRPMRQPLIWHNPLQIPWVIPYNLLQWPLPLALERLAIRYSELLKSCWLRVVASLVVLLAQR